jgi:hypothetical protein
MAEGTPMNKKTKHRVFSLSLRISHPSMTLDEVLAASLSMPECVGSVDPRLSPKAGADMGGVQDRTYA